MESMLRALLRASLIEAGWMDSDRRPLLDLSSHKVAPYLSGRWFDESLAILSCDPGDIAHPKQLWARWEREKPRWIQSGDHAPSILLVETTLRALPDILRGRALPTEVMFPGASTDLVGAIYRHNPVFDRVNCQLADALGEMIAARKRHQVDANIKILEVGAGTGATTSAVLDRLAAAGHLPAEYCFTDVSHLFLADAQQQFCAYANILRTQLLDLEAPSTPQDIAANGYDFVIAANVVHATANIRKSLRRIKNLLKHNGVLLLQELGAKTLFNHLTFGLLEGWWRCEDDALRLPGTPLLAADAWMKTLRSEGFRSVQRIASADCDTEHGIVVAESDGWVRSLLAASSSIRLLESASQSRPGPAAKSGDDHVSDMIRQFLANTLRIPEGDIGDHANLLEHGVDSLIAGRLINRINRSWKLTLRTNALFEHGTIAKLASHVDSVRSRRGAD